MYFEWDNEKELINIDKHGISFSQASRVFGDPKAIYLADPDHSEGEFREIALGKIENMIIIVVIFVERSKNSQEIMRIVSARRATKNEEAQYFSNEI